MASSKFQHRHYESIAAAVRDARMRTDHVDVVDMVARELAYTFEDDNPRFDPERFFKAVRGEGS
jgi:hypothetical protein